MKGCRYSPKLDLLGCPVNALDSVALAREWEYSSRSELVSATAGQSQYKYAYDTIGNRLASSVNAETNSYSSISLNQYTMLNRTSGASHENVSFTYDADGNMTGDGVNTYAYDCENRLVGVCPVMPSEGAVSVENGYDHKHRRIRKTVKKYHGGSWQVSKTHDFVWDGYNIILEKTTFADGTVNICEYFCGADKTGTEQGAGGVVGLLAISLNGVFYFPCYDHNGNIVRYVSESGETAAHYIYDPYGNVSEAAGTAPSAFCFGFSTKYHDRETGMVAYQRRFYSPDLGRWLNRDPIEERGGENLYAFCFNCPEITTDVLGFSSFVFIYDSSDPIFEQWAEDSLSQLKKQSKSRFGTRPITFDLNKDSIYMIPIKGKEDIDALQSIKDIKYLASFGHGRDGKIWWGYRNNLGETRSIVTGIPGNKLKDIRAGSQIPLSSLVLDYDKCGFATELYHCTSAERFEVDKMGVLVFANAGTSSPNKPLDNSTSTVSTASALSNILKARYPGVQFTVTGSIKGVSNGYPFDRGWPRPLGKIESIEVTK